MPLFQFSFLNRSGLEKQKQAVSREETSMVLGTARGSFLSQTGLPSETVRSLESAQEAMTLHCGDSSLLFGPEPEVFLVYRPSNI